MTLEDFRTACAALPAATYVNQWGGAHVYKVGGRIFAIAGFSRGGGPPAFAFKASEMGYQLLIEHGLAEPAPYLARAGWVRLVSQDALPDTDVAAYLGQAHALVAARLTRAARRALGLEAPPTPTIRAAPSAPG